MASFEKRGKKWRARVKVAGTVRTKTTNTKLEALEWAQETEKELRSLSGGVSLTHTIKDAFGRYAREVSPGKRGSRWELLRLAALEKDELAAVKLCDVRPADIAQWRDRRLKQVSGSTVNREMNLLSNVFTVARDEWHWIRESPTKKVKRPREAPPRDRIFTDHEIELICVCLDGGPIGHRVMLAFQFAIETAMRAGEICSLQPGSVQGRVAKLTETKNGFPREVPLSTRAREIWDELEEQGFNLTSRQIDSNFRKAKARAGIEDAVFHDTRHTAITRMANLKKLDILELARVTGHRDINQLRTYYNKTTEDIAKSLG